MYKRIFSGLTGAAFIIAVLFFNQSFPWIINLVTSIIAALAVKEIFSVVGMVQIYEVMIPTLAFSFSMPLIKDSIFLEIVCYLYTIMVLCALMINKDLKIKGVLVVYSLSIIVSYSLLKIVQLRDFGGEYGGFYVFLAFSIAWMSDTGAYFFGKFFGRYKLCPEISPKKTIEGFLGGIIVCLTCVTLVAFVFNNYVFPQKQQINYALILILGITGSILSSLGDLCFSMVKRRYNVKDFGSFMPGHGGVLDRFDSVVFVVPYVYIFLRLMPIIY